MNGLKKSAEILGSLEPRIIHVSISAQLIHSKYRKGPEPITAQLVGTQSLTLVQLKEELCYANAVTLLAS